MQKYTEKTFISQHSKFISLTRNRQLGLNLELNKIYGWDKKTKEDLSFVNTIKRKLVWEVLFFS